MESYQKTEKIISVISPSSLAIGLISGVLSLIYKAEFLDTIAVYGLTLFITPVLILQVAMTANVHTYGIRSMGKLSWVFYLLVFPFANFFFFAGINALYDIVPNYHLVERSLRHAAAQESFRLTSTYVGVIYFSLIGLGILLRNFKKPNQTTFT